MNFDIRQTGDGQTAASRIEQELRKLIIRLELLPGARLSEVEISKRLGVSRQPVREALIALGKSKLVEIRPNRGTVVARISARQMMEARFVREAVEVAVARRACEGFDDWAHQQIMANLDRQLDAARADDHNAFRMLDEQFHVSLAVGAGCGTAWNAISDMKAHMDRVCNLQLRKPDAMLALVDQHRRIMDEIDRRDPAAAAQAMLEHMKVILVDLPQIEANHPDLFEHG